MSVSGGHLSFVLREGCRNKHTLVLYRNQDAARWIRQVMKNVKWYLIASNISKRHRSTCYTLPKNARSTGHIVRRNAKSRLHRRHPISTVSSIALSSICPPKAGLIRPANLRVAINLRHVLGLRAVHGKIIAGTRLSA